MRLGCISSFPTPEEILPNVTIAESGGPRIMEAAIEPTELIKDRRTTVERPPKAGECERTPRLNRGEHE